MSGEDVYVEIAQSNYDLVGEDYSLDEVNHLLPQDFVVVEEKSGDNSAVFYSPSRNEIVLSFKGTTTFTDVREDIIDVGGSLLSANDGKYMEQIAKDYNQGKTKQGRKELKKSLSSNQKNIVQGFNKIYNLLNDNELHLSDAIPKISIVGHSLGSQRAIGVLEMMDHVDYEDGKLHDYFDIEAHVFNPAPYPADKDGNYYFLNDNKRLNVYASGITFEDEDFERLGRGAVRRKVIDDFESKGINVSIPSVRMAISKRADGKFYELTDTITGIPAIERGTFRSHFQPDKNYNFNIKEPTANSDATIGYVIDKALHNIFMEYISNPSFSSGFRKTRGRDDMTEYNRLNNEGKFEEAQEFLSLVGVGRGLYEMGGRDTFINTLREYSGSVRFGLSILRDIARVLNPKGINNLQKQNPNKSKADILQRLLIPLFKYQELADTIDPYDEVDTRRFGYTQRFLGSSHYLSHFTSDKYNSKRNSIDDVELTKTTISSKDVVSSIKEKQQPLPRIKKLDVLPPKTIVPFGKRESSLKKYCLLNPDDIICKNIKL